MDALEQLEELEAGGGRQSASSSDALGSSLSVARIANLSAIDDAPTSPRRRRRSIVKQEEMKDEGEEWNAEGTFGLAMVAVATPPSAKFDRRGVKVELTSPKGEICENLNCSGCNRNKETGLCFLTGLLLEWGLPGQRGAWCRDCHNVWRLNYSSVCTLVCFAVWLKVPVNYHKFEKSFICYLSLKLEGCIRVNEAMVTQRQKSLDFMLAMLSLPFEPCDIVPLGIARVNCPKLEARRLIPMLIASGTDEVKRQIGYMMASSSLGSNDTPLNRPFDSSWQGLRSVLVVGENDASELGAAFGGDVTLASEGSVGPPSKGSENQLAVSSRKQSGPEKKAHGIIGWALSRMQAYTLEDWTKVKEGMFTATVAKIMSAKAEVL